MGRFRKALAFAAMVLRPERLPPPPPRAQRRARRPVLRWLFVPEPLPRDPPAPPRPRLRPLRWIFGLERLDKP